MDSPTTRPPTTAVDFFAGIGLVRLGLERRGWSVPFSVDWDTGKRQMHDAHFGSAGFCLRDIRDVRGDDVPAADLAHASFPCTDLSLAGARGGLAGEQSSAFWAFVRILKEMGERAPRLVTLENVEGLLSSQNGRDLHAALAALNALGYVVDLLRIDATHFVPQSRVRLFIVGQRGVAPHDTLQQEAVLQAAGALRGGRIAEYIRRHPDIAWRLWPLPEPPARTSGLDSIVDADEPWWPADRTAYLIGQMSERHTAVLTAATQAEAWTFGTAFRRMRVRDGVKQSTAELRTDGVAGCLRTPKGGSARQIVVRAGFGRVDARLLNGRECARLMGADDYTLAANLPLNQALFGFGDAVCSSAVTWLSEHYLEPVLVAEHSAVFRLGEPLSLYYHQQATLSSIVKCRLV